YLGVDVIARHHVWHEDDGELVRIAADVIAPALARRDAAEESRHAEARFRALVQNSGDALIVLDEQGVVSHPPVGTRLFGSTADCRCRAQQPYEDELVSDMIEVLTGYPAGAFMANEVVFDDLILADHRERTDRELDAAVAEERPFIIEYPIRHANGTVRWLSEH